jgi:hypothetical protein
VAFRADLKWSWNRFRTETDVPIGFRIALFKVRFKHIVKKLLKGGEF